MQTAHLMTLETRHAALDRQIAVEAQRPRPDAGVISRLKRQKLRLKEAILAL